MNRTMITATNTLAQLQKQMDVISHNMANIDTNGYKRREATFTELIYQQFNNQRRAQAEVNRLTPNGIRQGTGAKLAQIQLVMTQGNIKPSDRFLDTALTKEGQLYKVLVQTDAGAEIQYTRNGAFYLSPISENELALVTADGHSIVDENNNPIYINADAKDFTIDSMGQMTVTMNNGLPQVFNLGVVQVDKPQFLIAKGNNLYGLPTNFDQLNVGIDDILTDLVGPLRTEIGIQQGALESSNVDMAKEMTDLINTQRAYQFQSRSVSIADQMMGLVNGIR
ncbi:flagellar hook-basal body complex protein FlhP [Robertmurraya siralis]|uniref:Flagellar hook-basal body complex protein FlhP n=1 Tax=Robertmurraya siralis TaxID=77777 RepID=A0A920BUK2_9BACI|nr:flagellar hook-basal body protein [Robertmurraya siralis]PAE19600.1 flagellar biosynthesis protein FlgG [Bacillus sp. 7504-2]GIN63018.1 flagellar hook-basal body complex protein FlhP [Robertmurraya siralis]